MFYDNSYDHPRELCYVCDINRIFVVNCNDLTIELVDIMVLILNDGH